jgi:HTH-type transcriptional regulator / antitoxin MqsA
VAPGGAGCGWSIVPLCVACGHRSVGGQDERRACCATYSRNTPSMRACQPRRVFIGTIAPSCASVRGWASGSLRAAAVMVASSSTVGKTKPPLALVKLLKVLDRHPELLSEVWVG